MENLPVYHGPIGKEEGERRLGHDGREGSYLLRNSDTVPGVFCLCVLCKGFVYTYRLHRDDAGSWAVETSPGVQKRYFRHIRNLIAAFQKPGQGLAMPLLYPVTAQSRACATGPSPPPGGPGGPGAHRLQATQPHSAHSAQEHRKRQKKASQQAIG